MRTIEVSRSEAELLVDLLSLVDSSEASDLGDVIRRLYGMVPFTYELEVDRKTLSEYRAEVIKNRSIQLPLSQTTE